MNGQMTAAVLYGKEDVKIEKVPIPRVGDGEVLADEGFVVAVGLQVAALPQEHVVQGRAPLVGHGDEPARGGRGG